MNDPYRHDVARILIDRGRLAARVREMGREIAEAFGGESVTVVPIMSGAMIFAADLIRELPLKMTINVIGVSSYAGATTVGGTPRIVSDLAAGLSGHPVLVVDDIFDTGRTLQGVSEHVRALRPSRLKSAVLLRKPARRTVDMHPDFVGFDVPDEFVVGYGLDYNGLYRNLPDIGVLRPDLYRNQPE